MPTDEPFSVLVADESASCCRTYRERLETAGYGVTSAGSGREAIEIVRRERIHVVVMEIRLPDYSGLEIYHAIKTIRDMFLPCIFTTLEVSARSFHEALSEDAVTILPKPVDGDRLVHAVEWSIDRYYSRRRRPRRPGRERFRPDGLRR